MLHISQLCASPHPHNIIKASKKPSENVSAPAEASFSTSSIRGSMLECGTTHCKTSLRVLHLLQQDWTYQVVTTWQFWSPSLHPPAVAFPAPLTFCPRHSLLHPFLPPQTQGPQGWKFCRLSASSSREPCATLIVSKGDFLAEGDW